MRLWERFSRRHQRGTTEAELVVARAYRNLFLSGNADSAQREAVLSDLAAQCSWNQITAPETREQTIWFNEGKRAAFAAIFSQLSLSPGDVEALENAARHEAHALSQDNQY